MYFAYPEGTPDALTEGTVGLSGVLSQPFKMLAKLVGVPSTVAPTVGPAVAFAVGSSRAHGAHGAHRAHRAHKARAAHHKEREREREREKTGAAFPRAPFLEPQGAKEKCITWW